MEISFIQSMGYVMKDDPGAPLTVANTLAGAGSEIQANFCRMPDCDNYSVPARTDRVKTGPSPDRDLHYNVLGWPAADDVMHPRGAGASVFATLVREKIGRTLQGLPEAQNARIGVLMADPDASTSEPPLAIVAEFRAEINIENLRELHRLSWNFSHPPIRLRLFSPPTRFGQN